MANLKIVNGLVWLDGDIQEAQILVQDGIIKAVARQIVEEAPIFDARGCIVLPGLIDVHAHLRDWGESYKEDLRTASRAAVAGGFTTLLEMPNTRPPIDGPEKLSERRRAIGRGVYCDVASYAMPQRPENVPKINRAGAVALKVYMHKSLGTCDYNDPSKLSELLSAAALERILVAFHAEHPQMIKHLENGYDAQTHSSAHPAEAEVESIKLILEVASTIPNSRVHIAHISTKKGLMLIRDAKRQRVRVSCEVTPHHLSLTRRDLHSIGRIGVVEPPLRTSEDKVALQRGLTKGAIEAIATDHAPHAKHEKASPTPPPGIPGLETALAVGLRLVTENKIALGTIIQALTTGPAKIFDLQGRGEIKPNYAANLTVVDLKKKWRIDSSLFESKAHYSPFDGWEAQGKTYATIVNGSVVYLEGEGVSGEFAGRYIRAS